MGCPNTPVMIPDTPLEDSFDIQGCFIGKLPFDSERFGKYWIKMKRFFSMWNFSIDRSEKNTRRTTSTQTSTINAA